MLLARQWKVIIAAGIAGALLLYVYSRLLPISYLSMATVLPPERQGMGGMLAFLSNSPVGDLLKGEAGSNPTTDLFKSVIDSRSVAEEVAQEPKIHAFLMQSDTSFKSQVERLRGSMASDPVRTGIFTVTVTLRTGRMPSGREMDSTRIMTAYIANKYVDALDRFNRDRLMTSARNTRVFIEGEYAKRASQLDSAYRALQAFQDAHQAISLPEQLTATVSAAAKLTSQIQELETAISIEERELGAASPRIKLLNAELDAARAQLSKYDEGGAGEYILALKNAPELTRELAHFVREAKVNEQLSTYLRTELEQQRISEQRDLPSLQILDPALPPTGPSAPNRKSWTLWGAIAGLFVGVLFILIRRFVQDVRARPEAHYRLVNLIRSVRYGKKAALITPLLPHVTAKEIPRPTTEAWRP